MGSSKHRAWTLGTDDAVSLVTEARRALFVMVGFLAILWLVQLVNFADGYRLSEHYGIIPKDVHSLPYLLTAPFLHVSWTHIESNSGPLFIFGFLAAYRGVKRVLGLTALVIVTSGMAAWLFGAPGTSGVGASGVVFGYLGYVLVKGLFDRHGIDMMIGAVMALCFAYQFTVLLPQAHIGYQDHIGGLVGGLAGGWIFRDRAAAAARSKARAAAKKSSPASTGTSTGTGTGTISARPASTVATTTPADPGTARQQERDTGVYSGPRADLHRQLDDLGL
ncbi:MAG TPA: rhomboid family intramembrane serine protease [Streptosporangiaceae bacterium]|nr:rhomboid family intramembrane serine protease [Streptosporangiaceae bacterium]